MPQPPSPGIYGSGPAAQAIRNHPWNETPLGPLDHWPGELRSSVNLILASRLISCIIWGPQRILIYNDAYEPLLGNKPKHLGEPFLEVWSEIREQADAIISEPWKTGEANLYESVPFWIRVDDKLVERICTLTNTPIWGETEDGQQILGLLQTIIDHTPGVLAERQLLESQKHLQNSYAELQAIYDGGAVAGALIDAHTFRYLRVNNKLVEMLNQPAEKLVGASVFDLAGDVIGLRSQLQQVAAGASLIGVTEEGQLTDGSGEYRYWHSNYVPVRSASGEITGIAAASIEVTDLKRAEAALVESEKLAAVGRLASSIAHEINNPLEAVMNLLYLINHEETTPEDRERYLTAADQQLRRVSMITNQTLRFHKQSTNPTAVLLAEVLEGSLLFYQSRLLNSAVKVETRFRTTTLIECFEGEIRQVVNNLIGNAIDALSHGGRLLLRIRETTCLRTGRRGLTFTIADNGSGMSAQTRRNIFKPFFTTKGIGGTGLGLWVSKEIVQRHEGALRVRSRQRSEDRPGWTVFTVSLPFDAVTRAAGESTADSIPLSLGTVLYPRP